MNSSHSASIVVAAVLSLNLVVGTAASQEDILDGDLCDEHSIVVSFHDGQESAGLTAIEQYFQARGIIVGHHRLFEDWTICDTGDPRGLRRMYVIDGVPDSAGAHRDALEGILTSSGLAHAVELDCMLGALFHPSPEGYADGWSLEFLDLDRAATASWSALVAVLDTGIDVGHPAFPTPVRDDLGFNYVDGNHDLTDFHGHGTHVAGIVAAVAPAVEIIPIKVLEDDGVGSWTAVSQGLLHAAAVDADVINLSLGTHLGFPQFFAAAVEDAAYCHDVVLVAAAGRSCRVGSSCEGVFAPAHHPAVLSVGALDSEGRPERRAAGGGDLDLLAPGVHVCSTWSRHAVDQGPEPYRSWSGSSLASAHAAGVAALLRATNPTWNAQDVRDRLVLTATPPTHLTDCGQEPGWLNACRAIHGLQGPSCADPLGLPRPDPGAMCEGDEGVPPSATTTLSVAPLAAGSLQGCTEVDYYAESSPAPVNTPSSFCPEETSMAPLRCASRVTGQPKKTPCPDCDAIVVSSSNLDLSLRLKSVDLSLYTSFLVRLRDQSGKVWVFSLGIGTFTGHDARIQVQLDVSGSGLDLNQLVKAELLSISTDPNTGRMTWVSDPLRIQ